MNFKEFSKLYKISRIPNHSNYERNIKKYRLDKNENTYDKLFSTFKNIIKKINQNDICSYPNLKKLYGIISKVENLNKNQILVTSGADSALKLIFEALIKKKDKIIITDPSFAMYDIYSKLFDTNCLRLRYIKENDRFKLKINILKKLVKNNKIKAIFLPNPDSPSGHVFNTSELKNLINFCNEKLIFLIIDEAYYPFHNVTSINLIKKYDNLIVVRTGSKSFGLAGLRVGFIAANSKIISLISKYRPIYEISSLSNKFYLNLYKNIKLIRKITKQLVEIKINFERYLQKLNFEVIHTNANFVLVNFGNKKQKIEKSLKKIAYIKNNVYIDKKSYSRITITDNYKIEKIKKLIKNA